MKKELTEADNTCIFKVRTVMKFLIGSNQIMSSLFQHTALHPAVLDHLLVQRIT